MATPAETAAQQSFNQQYLALQSRVDVYKQVVGSLSNQAGLSPLTPTQIGVLESSQRGQLDAQFQLRQFLNNDQQWFREAQNVYAKLQNYPSADPAIRSQWQQDSHQSSHQRQSPKGSASNIFLRNNHATPPTH